MNKAKGFLLAAAVAAVGFAVSCSGDDGGESGGGDSSSSDGSLGEVSSSSEATPSSSSVAPSSSSVVPSSSSDAPSSSSVAPSSSSVVPSSSSDAPSSSSVEPSSSSDEPSSSSEEASSSSDAPSSNSLSSSSSLAVVSTCGADFRPVTIGTQVWASENLNCDAAGSKCYDDDPANCAKYGRLYNWATAMGIDASYNSTLWNGSDVNHRGICPSGWHIPSNDDWDKLFKYVDAQNDGEGEGTPYNSETAGKYLKATSEWNIDGNGTDKYGFSALPGGNGYLDGFYTAGFRGLWWSASEYESGSSNAHIRYMFYYNESAIWDYSIKSYLFSVRCVKD